MLKKKIENKKNKRKRGRKTLYREKGSKGNESNENKKRKCCIIIKMKLKFDKNFTCGYILILEKLKGKRIW